MHGHLVAEVMYKRIWGIPLCSRWDKVKSAFILLDRFVEIKTNIR